MTDFSTTNSFTSGSPILASEMNENFDDLETFLNSTGVPKVQAGVVTAPMMASNVLSNAVVPVLSAHGIIGSAFSSATRMFTIAGDAVSPATDFDLVSGVHLGSHLDVTGKTREYRIVGLISCNATAPACNFTATLRPVSARAGGAGVLSGTIGSAATGLSVTVSTPAAGSASVVDTGWIAEATTGALDDAYYLCLFNSAVTAASSYTCVTLGLQIRYV